MEKINPLVIKINKEDGNQETYTLEFNRVSVMRAERKGFNVQNFDEMPLVGISDLFYYAFFMHHPNVTKEQTDKILFEELGGLEKAEIDRLADSLKQTYSTLLREEERKNSRVTVEL